MRSWPDESGRRKPRKRMRSLGLTAGVVFGAGFSLIGSALAGYLIGSYLDRNRNGALFAPAGLLLGLLAGLHRMYALFRHVSGDKDNGHA
ncbi:MAG: hypothetical protein ACOX4B_05380 [Bacillota bacterium]|nr:hypothetical protein [Candidatus Fermentithermobacillaceae bacterium]